MFKSPKHYRTFLTLVLTNALDMVGFSIVFPVLAPMLLNPKLHFFAADTALITKTTILGLIFALFGVAQFLGGPIVGALADHYGRYKVFLGTIAVSIVGYLTMAGSIYMESLLVLFIGRILTGFGSGNVSVAQSATADLTDVRHRSKAFGILLGAGGLGFIAGPWIGGKLANPVWASGSGAFIFAAVAALINLLMIFFFFTETWKPKKEYVATNLFGAIKDIRLVFHQKTLRIILGTFLLFSIGMAFFLVFSPTFFVQKFALGPDKIGDFFAYMAIWWTFAAMYLNKELASRFPLRPLILVGMLVGSLSLTLFVLPNQLWPYWIIFPINQISVAFGWINLGAILSIRAPDHLQGRVMGMSSSMWSLGQIIAPLIAGPLAGWKVYAPMLVGSAFIFLAFLYFLFYYTERNVNEK